MSIRAIWIMSLLPENMGKILFLRKFSTAERRAHMLHKDIYIPVPSEDELSEAVLLSLGLTSEYKQPVEWRDKPSRTVQLPIITIKIGEKELWPVLIIEQISCLLCCLPLINDPNDINFFHNTSISVGFSVLMGILSFLGLSFSLKSKFSSCFLDLDNYLSLSMPFGTPSDTEPSSIISLCNQGVNPFAVRKQHSWTQRSGKGKPLVYFEINECVRSAQSEQLGFHPIIEVYGSVIVKAEFETPENDVSITLSYSDSSQTLYLDSLITHPCVQSYSSTSVGGLPKRLWFTPPSYKFPVCYYRAHNIEPPLYGIYKMRGETSVELSLQLKLNDAIRNNFDFFEAVIPFFHRGPIMQFEFKSTQGSLQMSNDKHSLKWIIGNKFSSKTLDAVLTAKLELASEPLPLHNDPFSIDKNSYVQVNFKQSNTTLSGCIIDLKSVTVSPACKPKLTLERSFRSTEYRIWNCYGDLPFSLPLPRKQKE